MNANIYKIMDDWTKLEIVEGKAPNPNDLFLDQMLDDSLFEWDETDAGVDNLNTEQSNLDTPEPVNLEMAKQNSMINTTDHIKYPGVNTPDIINIDQKISNENVSKIHDVRMSLLKEMIDLYGAKDGYNEFIKKTQPAMTTMARRRNERGL